MSRSPYSLCSGPLAVLIGALLACAPKVHVTDQDSYAGGKLPRPEHVYVYDFAGTPEDVPPTSSLSGKPELTPAAQSAEDRALNRQIGAELAEALVAEIEAMGMPAYHATPQTVPSWGDLVLQGTLLSVVEGSATERVAIGMGKGAAELRVALEGFRMTPDGLVKLGGGTAGTEASKSPGAAVPLGVLLATKNPIGLIVSTGMQLHREETGEATIHGKVRLVAKQVAAVLRTRFEEQGWIPPAPAP
jgi:hypothetical protein